MFCKLLLKLEINIVKLKLKLNSVIKGFFVVWVIVVIVLLVLLLLVWGIDFFGFLVFFIFIIMVIGVVFFVSWLFISNIIVYFILFINVVYCRGNYVCIFDGDNFIEGVIVDVGLFSMCLFIVECEIFMYFNNLILICFVLFNFKEKWGVMGKVVVKLSVEMLVVKIEESKLYDELF